MNRSSTGLVIVGVPDGDDAISTDAAGDDRLDAMLDAAAALSRQRQSSILLLHALRRQDTRRPPGVVEHIRAVTRARDLLNDATLRLTNRVGYRVQVQVMTSPLPPVTALVDASRHADLLLILRRHLSAPKRLLHGFITSSVALQAYCPVMVLPDGRTGGNAYVLAAVSDGASRSALGFAFEEASWRRVPLVAMHAWEHDDPDGYERGETRDEYRLRAYERGERVLGEALSGFASRYPDVVIRRQLVSGALLDTLIPATNNAQLAVLGRMHRDGDATQSRNEVAHVLHRSQCPVVVVPASEAARPPSTVMSGRTRVSA